MKNLKWLAVLAALALSFAFPFVVGDPTVSSLAVDTLLFCTAATAWNIFSGYTGYISLGHATYFGLGAYTMAIVCQDWKIQGGFVPFLILPLTGFVALCFALPLGWIAVRTKGQIFIVLTLAIFFIFQSLASSLSAITGGSGGIYLPNPPWDASFLDMPFYFAALVLLLLVLLVAWWIRTSKYGLGLLAIRDDEDRARGLGIKTEMYKLIAYVLSAFFIGMVGALTIYYIGNASPDTSFSPTFDVLIALLAFLGGRDTLIGPLVGGTFLVPLEQWLIQQYSSPQLELVIYGGVLLVVILLLPQGIVPSLSKRWSVWMTTRHRQVLQPHQPALAEGHLQPASLVGLVRGDEKSIPNGQRSDQRPIPLPLSSSPRVTSLPTTTGFMQRVKSQRLVAIQRGDSLMTTQGRVAAPLATRPNQKVDYPVVSWRCPRCQKPFLLKGTSCYCPRCGIVRSLPHG